MSLLEIIRLLSRYFWYITGTAIVLTSLVFFGTKNDKEKYATHTLLNTGLISGYSIESSSIGRIDYAKTNNELENLINLATSYETNKELSARLMARLISQDLKSELNLKSSNYQDFSKAVKELPLELRVTDSEEAILFKIIQLRDTNKENAIYKLVNSKDPFFGVEQLETITVAREGKSDMIRIEYSSIDPLLSTLTLELLTEIFISKQKSIKEGQTDSVITFFKEAVEKSDGKLKNAEDKLLNFRVNNQIINYYEQTRFISGNKQELDKQYHEELKVLAASTSALEKLEAEISDKSIIPSLHSKIAQNRSEISRQTALLTQLELVSDTIEDPSRVIKKTNLNWNIDSLKQEMTNIAAQLIQVNQTPDGIETKDILFNWLNQVITKEESSAKIGVMKTRQQEYDSIYNRFSPLGSTLKRLEREIDVAEKAYLENLHSYNQARLHKYSSQMSSNLKVIDAPYFPNTPLKSKRMLMVILAFVLGIVLPTSLIVALELTDSSLKKPENAQVQTKMKVAGVFAKQPRKSKEKGIDYQQLNNQSLNLLVQALRAKARSSSTPQKIVVLSTQHGEGKTTMLNYLNNYLSTFLLNNSQNAEFEFEEIGAILHEPYHEQDVKDADIHLLVARANRKWTAADKHAVKVYSKLVGKKPLLCLNAVSDSIMEDIIGEVPKYRSWLRRTIRHFLIQGFKPSTI